MALDPSASTVYKGYSYNSYRCLTISLDLMKKPCPRASRVHSCRSTRNWWPLSGRSSTESGKWIFSSILDSTLPWEPPSSFESSTASAIHAVHGRERERIMAQEDLVLGNGLQTLKNSRPWTELAQWEETYVRYRQALLSTASAMESTGMQRPSVWRAWRNGTHLLRRGQAKSIDASGVSRPHAQPLWRDDAPHKPADPLLAPHRTEHGSSCLLRPFHFGLTI